MFNEKINVYKKINGALKKWYCGIEKIEGMGFIHWEKTAALNVISTFSCRLFQLHTMN